MSSENHHLVADKSGCVTLPTVNNNQLPANNAMLMRESVEHTGRVRIFVLVQTKVSVLQKEYSLHACAAHFRQQVLLLLFDYWTLCLTLAQAGCH